MAKYSAADFQQKKKGKYSAADFSGKTVKAPTPIKPQKILNEIAEQKDSRFEPKAASFTHGDYALYKAQDAAPAIAKMDPSVQKFVNGLRPKLGKPIDIRDVPSRIPTENELKSPIVQFTAGAAESTIPRAVSAMAKLSTGKAPLVERMKEESAPYSNGFRTAGKIYGEAFGNFATYGIVGKAIGATGAIQKIASPFLRNVVAGQLADTAIQTPVIVAEGVANKQSPGQIAKNIGMEQATDLAGNIAFAGAESLIKGIFGKLKAGKALTKPEIETVQKVTRQAGGDVNEPVESQVEKLNQYFQSKRIEPLNGKLPKSEPRPIGGEQPKVVSPEPEIPAGKKERGFSANTRTDTNNPDALRDSFSEKPLTYEQVSNGDTLSKAQAIMGEGYESARTKVSSLAANMQPEAVPLAKMLARQATDAGNVQGAREILSDVAEKLTQAGQFSQAARLLRESDPETFLMTIDKQLRKLNEEGAQVYGNKWKGIDLTPGELDEISKLKPGDEKAYEAMFEKIGDRIAKDPAMPSSATEKLNTWRHVAMLLNPKTQIRNVVGNTLMLGMRRTAKQVSAVLQNILLKPGERTQVFFVKPEYKQTAKDYFETNKRDLLRGGNKYAEGIKLNMPGKRVFKNNLAEGMKNITFKGLELGDTPYFKNAYVNRLASYAQAKGISDFTQLPEEAFSIAKKEAEEATYKDASALASLLTKWKHPGKDAGLGKKLVAVGTEAVMPFTKTPINIIKRGIQYSPAGVINGLFKGRTAEGIDEVAKGLTGTGVVALGYWLASKGILTGSADKDKDLAAYDKSTGKYPFSVMGQYTYDWAQPFAVPLTMGVEVYNTIKDNPEDVQKLQNASETGDQATWLRLLETVGTGIQSAFEASGNTVFNMSVLKNIKDALGNGTNGVMQAITEIPANMAMQFIPSTSGQTAGMIDPTVRQTFYTGKPLESFKAQALSKIPFASKTLEPKLTPWGEPVKRPANPFVRAFGQFLSPGNINVPQDINPEVDAELRRLASVGEKTPIPTVAMNSFNFNGKIDLSPKEYTNFQQTLGRETMKAYEEIMKSPEYQAASDADKAKMLSAAITDSKNTAKFGTLQGRGLAHNPLVLSMPSKLTVNKNPFSLTPGQQSELADLIKQRQDELLARYRQSAVYKSNPAKYDEMAREKGRAAAEEEYKKRLISPAPQIRQTAPTLPKASQPSGNVPTKKYNSTSGLPPDYGKGNIDLNDRPLVKNPDGSISTVFSITLWPGDIPGLKEYVLIPGVRKGLNRKMTTQEAADWYVKTGEYLGKFKSDAEAEAYANSLHEQQAKVYNIQ